MEQTNTVILENGEQYVEINSLIYEGNKYVLLSNLSNNKDICVRKVIKEFNRDYICRLEDSEFNIVFNKLIESNQNNNNGNN